VKRLRRWVWGLMALFTAAEAQPDPSLQFQTQVLVRGATTTELVAQVPDTPALAAGSLLAWQFELPLALQAATLRSPGGIETPLDLARDLHVVRAATRHLRARGDAWQRREFLREPEPGRWTLKLQHAPARGGERIEGIASVRPRFALRLARVEERLLMGSESVLTLDVSDYGGPLAGLAPRVRWRAPDGQGGEASMVESLALPRVQRITEQPGRYEWRWRPTQAGRHEVVAELSLLGRGGRAAPLPARVAFDVAAGPLLRPGDLSQVAEFGAGGCVAAWHFSIPWQAAAAGRYVMVLRLQGTDGEFQVQSGVDVDRPGPLTLALRMAADDARRLSAQPLTQAVRLDVTHFTAERADLVQRLRDVPLPQPLERARFCR
jgi:hypothetical protein